MENNEQDIKIYCDCCKSLIKNSYYCYECDSLICSNCRIFNGYDDDDNKITDENVNCKNCIIKNKYP